MGAPELKPILCPMVFLVAALALPAASQELSDSELTQRLIAQREAVLGKSRGLVLTTVNPAQEATAGALPPPVTAAAAPEVTPEAVKSTAVYVDMPEEDRVFVQVTFAFDSAALAETQKPNLRQICKALDAANVGVLRIVGHTDAAGPAPYNQKLSVLRAEEVKRFFVNDCGIAVDRLQAVGVGEQFPFDDTNPLADDNRRVEFQAIS